MNKTLIAAGVVVLVGVGFFLYPERDSSTVEPGTVVGGTQEQENVSTSTSGTGSTGTGSTGSGAGTGSTGTGSGSTGGGSGFAPMDSGIRGTVMIGPSCPTVQYPPVDNSCDDKPFSTSVSIYFESNPTSPILILKSDAQGKFSADVVPGDYIVRAKGGGNAPPGCPEARVTVTGEQYTTVTINCDSGIR